MQTFTGIEYLKIDIASSFGLDKRLWSERLSWFEENQGKLHDLVSQAAEPALFYAGVLAWEATQRGEPSGYPISIDATASGLQLLACLTGDRSAAEICNVVPAPGDEKRADAYTAIYEHMLDLVGDEAKITRQKIKDAVMPAWYGSTALPKKVFGEGELLASFHETMQTLTPACWELNEAFLAIWNPTAEVYEWVLPDNFHVRCKIMTSITETVNFLNEPFEVVRRVNAPTKDGRALGANTIHSLDGMIVREMTRRCMFDVKRIEDLRAYFRGEACVMTVMDESDRKMCDTLWAHYQASGYLSARILDHLDPFWLQDHEETHQALEELLDSMPEKPFQILSVHDCFRCLPNYGNELRRQYIRQLYEVARSNLLSFLLSQLVHHTVTIGKLDPNMAEDVLKTEYALS